MHEKMLIILLNFYSFYISYVLFNKKKNNLIEEKQTSRVHMS